MGFNFVMQEWATNTNADKTCKELFSKKQTAKSEVTTATGKKGRNVNKSNSVQSKIKKKKQHIQKLTKTSHKKIKGTDLQKRLNVKEITCNFANDLPQKKKILKAKVIKSNAASDITHNNTPDRSLKKNKKKGSKQKLQNATSVNDISHEHLTDNLSQKKKGLTAKFQKVGSVNNFTSKYPTDNLAQNINKKRLKTNHSIKKEKESELNANIPLSQEKQKKPSQIHAKTNKKSKKQSQTKLIYQSGTTRKEKLNMSLRERMLEKLKGAQFRYLNEQMYTSSGHDAKKYFESNPNDYNAYHVGYRQQVNRWPLNPLDVLIAKINKMPTTHIIADFGCGDARLAKSVSQKVHSFDLVAVDDSVTACDMSKVPLKNSTVDVVVFCLSLMGTNLKEFVCEAARVLKTGGRLIIAEVESRFENVDAFIQNIQKFGFEKGKKDLSHDLFYFLDFKRKECNVQKQKLPNLYLNPCLYKKR